MRQIKECQHEPQQIESSARRFSGSVAIPPYTEPSREAQGNITITEECRICGAQRPVNVNGNHKEYGPYGLSREQQREMAIADAKADDAEMLRKNKIKIVDVGREIAVVTKDGETMTVSHDEILLAASQFDEYLAALYTSLARVAGIIDYNNALTMPAWRASLKRTG